MVSQRSTGQRPPTLDDRTLSRARRTAPTEPATPPPFPRELGRCRCGTASFDANDHANACPLGPDTAAVDQPQRDR